MVQSLLNCTRYNIIRASQPSVFRSIIIHFYSYDIKNLDGNLVEPNTEISVTETSKKANDISEQSSTLPEPPTTCCMSGCANCVWIEYADKFTKLFNDDGEKARKQILENVTDLNMRAFLEMELRNMKLKK